MACELCDLVAGDVKTRFYYKNKTCIIVDCLTCHIPMAVLAHHGAASEREKGLIMNAIESLFEYGSIRFTPRKILDHTHYHIEGARYHGS